MYPRTVRKFTLTPGKICCGFGYTEGALNGPNDHLIMDTGPNSLQHLAVGIPIEQHKVLH